MEQNCELHVECFSDDTVFNDSDEEFDRLYRLIRMNKTGLQFPKMSDT